MTHTKRVACGKMSVRGHIHLVVVLLVGSCAWMTANAQEPPRLNVPPNAQEQSVAVSPADGQPYVRNDHVRSVVLRSSGERLRPAVPAHVVTGTVTSADDGRPLPGVNVLVKGTTIGSATDEDGRYSVDAPAASDTLQFSFIGFLTQEIPIDGRSVINIILGTDEVALDEVIVVGYGTQRRSDVTGVVASIDAERLENLPTTDVAQAIEGLVPGVTVSTTEGGAEQSRRIQIRGQNSILASNSPLIVLDGIPYGGALSEISQSDIESIEVLKDASASAIYGSRGSNGVVLITTKKGSGAPSFSYDGYAGIQNAVNVPSMMTGEEYGAFKCQWLNDGVPCNGDANLLAEHLSASELEVLQTTGGENWYDRIMRTGFQQQHNLSVSGGVEGTRYYVGGSLLDVSGVAQNDEFRRYTLRVNLDQEINSWLDAGTSTQLGWTDRSGEPGDFSGAYHMNPLSTAMEADGRQKIYPWPEDPFFENPLQPLLAEDDDAARRVFTSNYIRARLPIDGLTFRINAGLDFGDRARSTYYGRNTATGTAALGHSTTIDSESLDWTVENILNYARTVGEHSFDLTGLFSAQQYRFQDRRLRATGFPGDELTYWQPSAAQSLTPGSSFAETGMISQMGRFNYSYLQRYLLTATARRDGSSAFGDNYKYGVFPSVAVGWHVSREPFWGFDSAVNALKVRASWGINGNQAISPYQTLSRLRTYSYVDGTSPAIGYIPSALGNPDLRWEKSETINLGVDFGILSDRITGTLDLYRTSTTDLLLDRVIPSTHGIAQIITNLGEVRNRGVELLISTVNVENGRLRWTTDFNISANRNKIVDLYGDGTDDIVNSRFIGQPINVNFGYERIGIWQEDDDIANSPQPEARPGDVRLRDVNGDGTIDADDRTIHSDPNPRYLAGLRNNIQFGNFSFSFFLHTVQGGVQWNDMLDVEEMVYTEVRRNTLRLDYWTPENRSNSLPGIRQATNPLLSLPYQDASFVRLKDVTLSYSIPQRLRSRLGVSDLLMYVSAVNLVTWTSWDGLDPELASDLLSPDGDGEQLDVPLNRTIVAGIRLGF